MIVKITARNQLELQSKASDAKCSDGYPETDARHDQIIPARRRTQKGDAVRSKLADLWLGDADVAQAVRWARGATSIPHP